MMRIADSPPAVRKKSFSYMAVISTLLLISLIALVWVESLRLASGTSFATYEPSDLAAVLFAASSFAVLAFSIILAIAAVVGWQKIGDAIDVKVEKSFRLQSETFFSNVRGRQYAAMGYSLSYLAIDQRTLEIDDSSLLNDAIDNYELAYDIFPSNEPYHWTILNNLVFLYCLREDPVDRDFCLRHVNDMLLEAQRSDRHRFMALAASRAKFLWGEDKEAGDAARFLAKWMEDERRPVSIKDKEEAKVHLNWLKQRRNILAK